MNISIVLAQILGISYMVLGLSMLVNKKWTAKVVEEIMSSQGLIWLAGLITVSMGAVMVALNNSWTSGLPLYITILGWLTLIKGAVIMIFPKFTVSYYKKFNAGDIFMWGGVVIFILGGLLAYSSMF